MGYATGWYTNSSGRRVYGRHSTSSGYYNKYGKWVNSSSKPSSSGHTPGGHTHGGSTGTGSPRGEGSGGSNTVPAPARENSNDKRKAHGLFVAGRTRLSDGGETPSIAGMADASKRQLNFNLSNNEDVAQGSETEWSQPTSISNLISGQLRQSDNAPKDAWAIWAQNNSQSSPITASQQQQQVQPGASTSQPMGAFGLNSVMDNYGGGEQQQAQYGTFGGWGVDATGKTTFKNAGDEEEWKTSSVYANVTARADTSYKTKIDSWVAAGPKVAATPGYTRESSSPTVQPGERVVNVKTNQWNANKIYVIVRDATPETPGRTVNDAEGIKLATSAYNSSYKKGYADWFNITSPADAKYMNSYGTLTTSYKKAYQDKLDSDEDAAAAQAIKDKEAAAAQAEKDRLAREAEAKRIKDNADAIKARQTSADLNLQNYSTFGVPIQSDMLGDDSYNSNLYNPWGRMEGASQNRYGPSSETLGKATMEAMAMANAYFAPQRAELAYELGDMETDMRRLAVNLGRQVDDPVLQAKLYKEGMRSVRTLDVQQNTFAFQLADARRKEENQNFQFYDQLAQEESKIKLANRQYFESLDLQKNQYNLNAWSAANPVVAPYTGQVAAKEQQQTGGGVLAKRKV